MKLASGPKRRRMAPRRVSPGQKTPATGILQSVLLTPSLTHLLIYIRAGTFPPFPPLGHDEPPTPVSSHVPNPKCNSLELHLARRSHRDNPNRKRHHPLYAHLSDQRPTLRVLPKRRCHGSLVMGRHRLFRRGSWYGSNTVSVEEKRKGGDEVIHDSPGWLPGRHRWQ